MADRIPTPAEIATLSPAELRALAQRLGVTQAHVAQVTEAIRRATSRLIGANLPSEALVRAVTEATDRAIRRELQHVTRDLIRDAQAREQGVTAGSLMRWQSVGDDRVCDDCEARHGSVQTYAEWQADGLPGSRNTVCNGNCRCEILPEDSFTGPYEKGDVKVTVSLEAG